MGGRLLAVRTCGGNEEQLLAGQLVVEQGGQLRVGARGGQLRAEGAVRGAKACNSCAYVIRVVTFT